MACMVLGGAALAGIPPTAGFFSKEALVGVLAEQANPIWLAAALAGVFLTAYYTFRLIFVMLFPASPAANEGAPHDRKAAYACMAVPLLVLAAAALLLGWGMRPIVSFLGRTGLPPGGGQGHATTVLLATLLLNAAALVLAWYEFGRRGAAQRGFVERLPAVARFFEQRWYLDHLYRWALDTLVYRGIAALCQFNDQRMIDAGLDGLSRGTISGGGGVARLHTSMIQYRLLIIFAVMALAALFLVL
jgi:NADH-quinone oxidoreductase subunit L